MGSFLPKKLVKLDLNFSRCYGLSDEGLIPLSRAIGRMVTLRQLSLRLRACHSLTSKSLNDLGYSLCSLRELEELSLNFSNCNKILYLNETQFFSGISMNEKLKKLELDFSSNGMFDRLCMANLKMCLLSLKGSLNTLTLSFKKCEAVRKEEIGYLYETVAKMEALEEIEVNLDGNQSLTSETISNAICVLKEAKKLKFH